MKSHTHSATSNTPEVFRSCIGCRVKGVYHENSGGNDVHVLVFECGEGLAFCSTGAYWSVRKEDIHRSLLAAKEKLQTATRELAGVLSLAVEPS